MFKQLFRLGKIHRRIFKRKQKETIFKLDAQEAQQVFLVGDFNNWDEHNLPMHKNGDGRWHAEVNLCAGEFEYKFIVDGQWTADPANDKKTVNLCGTYNSVKKVVIE